MKYHKPNMGRIKDEADRIREEDKNRGTVGFYDIKSGDNVLRIVPPWSARGDFAKKVHKHFMLPREQGTKRCLSTWSDKFEECPICAVLEKVQTRYPNLDLKRQEKSTHYQIQVVDRDEEEKGVQICQVTPAVYNWIVLQMDNPKIGDVTDPENGFDINIVKTEEKRKRGKGTQIKYTPGFIPGTPPPLADSEDEIDKLLSQIADLDVIYGPPSDDELMEIEDAAKKVYSYYIRRGKEANDSDFDNDNKDTDDDVVTPPKRGERNNKEDKKEDKKEDSKKENTRKSYDDVDIDGVPECFAGLKRPVKHDDGSIGYNEDLEKCIICPNDLECMSAKEKRDSK